MLFRSEFIDPSNKLARIVRPTRWRGFSDCEVSVIIGNRGDAKSQVVAFAGLGRLMQTPQADRRLLVRAWATAIAAKIVLRFFGVENLRAWASRQGRGRADFERIVWAARVVARRMPAATCLSSALALQRELSDNGYHSELHIGVARNEIGRAHV